MIDTLVRSVSAPFAKRNSEEASLTSCRGSPGRGVRLSDGEEIQFETNILKVLTAHFEGITGERHRTDASIYLIFLLFL
jgi:hypothetical protein